MRSPSHVAVAGWFMSGAGRYARLVTACHVAGWLVTACHVAGTCHPRRPRCLRAPLGRPPPRPPPPRRPLLLLTHPTTDSLLQTPSSCSSRRCDPPPTPPRRRRRRVSSCGSYASSRCHRVGCRPCPVDPRPSRYAAEIACCARALLLLFYLISRSFRGPFAPDRDLRGQFLLTIANCVVLSPLIAICVVNFC